MWGQLKKCNETFVYLQTFVKMKIVRGRSTGSVNIVSIASAKSKYNHPTIKKVMRDQKELHCPDSFCNTCSIEVSTEKCTKENLR